MGYDISHHVIDPGLIRQRLVPAITRGESIDDLLTQAALLGLRRHRAAQWGLRVAALERQLCDAQREAVPKQTHQRPNPVGGFNRLLGVQAIETVTVWPQVSGLPGFDSDLSVWGRPFYIEADSTDAVLDAHARYMACRSDEDVDQVAREMVSHLETRRHRVRPGLQPEAPQVLAQHEPWLSHLPEADPAESIPAPPASVIADRMRQRIQVFQQAWSLRQDDEASVFLPWMAEEALAGDLALQAPHFLVGLATQLQPAWTGRGHVWLTALFEKIGVDLSDLVETPASLFGEMLQAHPALAERFQPTLFENYCLGGHVPPDKVPALLDRIQQHRRALILAWMDGDEPEGVSTDLDELATDFKKLIEPVTLAHRLGHGFLEAAECSTGVLGLHD